MLIAGFSSSDIICDTGFINLVRDMGNTALDDLFVRLIESPIICLPTVYVLLLAGDLSNAVKVLAVLSRHLTETQTNNNMGDSEDSCHLLDAIWNLICSHPSCAVQCQSLGDAVGTYELGDKVLNNRKLCALAPTVVAAQPHMLDGLKPFQKLELLQRWRPDPSVHGMQLPQKAVQVSYLPSVFSCEGAAAQKTQDFRVFVTVFVYSLFFLELQCISNGSDSSRAAN